MVCFAIFNQNRITTALEVMYILCGHNLNKMLKLFNFRECMFQVKFPKTPET